MTEIIQEMGFDAAKALQTIKQLDTDFKSLFGTLSTAPQAFSSFNSSAKQSLSLLQQMSKTKPLDLQIGTTGGGNPIFKQAAPDALAADRAVQQLRRSVNSITPDSMNRLSNATIGAGRSAERLTVSFGLVSRVIATQATVSAFGGLRRGIGEAVSDSIELQKQIAQTGAITDTSAAKIQNVSRVISDAFNVDQIEASRAVYAALQNDVGSFADASRVAAGAAALVKVAGGDQATAVDALSSAVNSFGVDTKDLDDQLGLMLQSTKDGRIEIADLSKAYGTLGATAKQSSVSQEEMLAALAAMTSTGTNADIAITRLGSLFTTFSKPTEEMTAALKRMGFESGQSAIASKGLGPVLEGLFQSVNGNAEAFRKLFPNVNAARGALALTGDNANTLARFTANATNEVDGLAQRMLDLATNSPGERLGSDFNQLKNVLIDVAGAGVTAFDGFIQTLAEGAAIASKLKPIELQIKQIAFAAKVAADNFVFFADAIQGTDTPLANVLSGNAQRMADEQEVLKAAQEALVKDKQTNDSLMVGSDTAMTTTILNNHKKIVASLRKQLDDSKLLIDASKKSVTNLEGSGKTNQRPQDQANQAIKLLGEAERQQDQAKAERARQLFAEAQANQQKLADVTRITNTGQAVPVDPGAVVRLREMTQAFISAERQLQSRVSNNAIQLQLQPDIAAAQQIIGAAEFRAILKLEPRVEGPIPEQGLMFGGKPSFFANGGRAGTDTIPAMLSKGETVIDAVNSRRFFSELNSIRAGVEPVFRESGGGVSVGDVTINNTRQVSDQTNADQLIDRINRMSRRGKTRIK